VDTSESLWFSGPFGFVLTRARPSPAFSPLRGQLGFFKVSSAELGW